MILAAGKGTRLKSLTREIPKPMLEIGGKPILEHLINLLKKYGVNEIAMNLHHLKDAIKGYFGDGEKFGVRITYSYEEELLGSAGAVKKLEDFFSGTFFVVYGDLFTNADLKKLIEFHRDKSSQATIALYEVENPEECGIVGIDAENRIEKFIEKPAPCDVFTNLANAGIYVLEPEIIDFIPENKFFDFGRDLFPVLIEKKIPLYGYPVKEYLADIGTADKYERAQKAFLAGKFYE
ncbi:MAG: nucleotidyltransferase family protein [bacterium]